MFVTFFPGMYFKVYFLRTKFINNSVFAQDEQEPADISYKANTYRRNTYKNTT